ncbi:MAG: T9SS type A sorting domain-containing protein, partial [Candidatus Electryoneaceae bacterium]|nr:T9SS type A sorting domain-containing protein [Candidatus Electryoneaceae bacterium]
PTEGVIDPDEPTELNITFNTFNVPAEVEMDAIIRFEHNGRGEAVELPVNIFVTNAGGRTQRTLDLRVGWNMVSLNIEPDEDDVPAMMQDLVDNGTLVLVKDDQGRFFAPLANMFNDIPNWNFAEGYLFKMARSDQLHVEGIGIEADREIALTQDWQMISYYPRNPIDAPAALAGIHDQLIIAKNVLGHFYVPEHNFSNIGRMREGQGYMVKMSEDAVLVYPFEQEDRLALTSFDDPTHFVTSNVTDRNMSLLLLDVPNVLTEIAAVDSDGLIVGIGTSDGFGRIGLAVWGCGIDGNGLSEGEPFTLIGWDGSLETVIDIEWTNGRSEYVTDELAIGRIVDLNGIPDEYALYQAYPNPFNARTMIRYDLPEATSVSLELFDANGRLVATLIDGHQVAGSHSAVIDAGRMASGIYFYRLQTDSFVQIRKAVLLR